MRDLTAEEILKVIGEVAYVNGECTQDQCGRHHYEAIKLVMSFGDEITIVLEETNEVLLVINEENINNYDNSTFMLKTAEGTRLSM